MRAIELLAVSLRVLIATTGPTHARTLYSGEFDYRQFQSSKAYFEGRSDASVARLCATGERASNGDLGQCAHRQFERTEAELRKPLARITKAYRLRDEQAASDNEPLALPRFEKSQNAWIDYRDQACYREAYALGESSERYIDFWRCMAAKTQARVNELEQTTQSGNEPTF